MTRLQFALVILLGVLVFGVLFVISSNIQLGEIGRGADVVQLPTPLEPGQITEPGYFEFDGAEYFCFVPDGGGFECQQADDPDVGFGRLP